MVLVWDEEIKEPEGGSLDRQKDSQHAVLLYET